MAKGLQRLSSTSRPSAPPSTPGARWGTLGEPIRRMQKPPRSEASKKHLAMPAGFEAKLFVAEPQIFKPITMTWDHLGRLYVAETVDYPNEMQPKGKGRDRISIVEDTDGDGKADKVFALRGGPEASRRASATSTAAWSCAQAPDMLFLRDTDGDGKGLRAGRSCSPASALYDTHAGPVEPALRAG